jgi:hypothetical protein
VGKISQKYKEFKAKAKEFGELSNSFDSLTKRVEDTKAALPKATEELIQAWASQDQDRIKTAEDAFEEIHRSVPALQEQVVTARKVKRKCQDQIKSLAIDIGRAIQDKDTKHMWNLIKKAKYEKIAKKVRAYVDMRR